MIKTGTSNYIQLCMEPSHCQIHAVTLAFLGIRIRVEMDSEF